MTNVNKLLVYSLPLLFGGSIVKPTGNGMSLKGNRPVLFSAANTQDGCISLTSTLAPERLVRTTRGNSVRYLAPDSLEGRPLPDFTLPTLTGETITLNQLKGKVIVLNFWFIGCKPCIMEMPALNRLVKSYEKNPDVVFLAPALDGVDDLKTFLQKREFLYKVSAEARFNLAGQFRLNSFPVNMVINKEGIIQKVNRGLDTELADAAAPLRKEIEKALAVRDK